MVLKIKALWQAHRERLSSEEGASSVEYALIAGLIAIVIIVAVSALGIRISDVYAFIADELGFLV